MGHGNGVIVIKKSFSMNNIMQKLFIKNTVPSTNYTPLHQLGGFRER